MAINRNKKFNFEKLFFNQKFLSLLGLIVIVIISFPFAKNEIKRYRINKEIEGLKKEISDMQSKGADLKKFVSYLESDQFAEEQARLNLGLKKSGEELTVIKNEPRDLALASSVQAGSQIFNIPGYQKDQPLAKTTNPAKWLNYFLK